MASLVRAVRVRPFVFGLYNLGPRMMSNGLGELGSGSGKGGGAGGSIREAGGTLGKKEVAEEEMYFRRMQQQQLGELKKHHADEIRQRELDIKRHKEAIERHKQKIRDIERTTPGSQSDSD
ncbi:PREDICTED: ATPase inhibitor, mitochondrial-like [Branchiostoma belcheri]|uniref:ATPase inhibitor, mitochondrial-like n=1 Tax=Branchiostoma belcheri TaxID=7741 RepID=A0A6P5AIG5_BRABE|nr:PREDICTED: ATPase inhibitor, mitochondrial-like [Branchiostoma belcheri]KAI8505761.1 hypothetical protein Bbelb_161140 [Branchiostoma belcheri]